jgi:hypothetical protein
MKQEEVFAPSEMGHNCAHVAAREATPGWLWAGSCSASRTALDASLAACFCSQSCSARSRFSAARATLSLLLSLLRMRSSTFLAARDHASS